MKTIEWTSEFAVGIDTVDLQHRELVAMINGLSAAVAAGDSRETTRTVLQGLNDYAIHHFGLEERLMRRGGCEADFFARHCGEHAYFRGVLKDFIADFDRGERSVSLPLTEYLVHWLLHHIVVTDRQMARLLHAAEPNRDPQAVSRQAQEVADELASSERHLLSELRHAQADLQRQVEALSRQLDEAKAEIATLRARPDDAGPG